MALDSNSGLIVKTPQSATTPVKTRMLKQPVS